MRTTLYDPKLPATHSVTINEKARYDGDRKIRIPGEVYMSWIVAHDLREKDWRIEGNEESTLYVFRDPGIAMLFKLAFV